MYWRRVEEEQHHWDERRRLPDGAYPQGPPGLLGVRPGLPGLQPQGPVVGAPLPRHQILDVSQKVLNQAVFSAPFSRPAGPTPQTIVTS